MGGWWDHVGVGRECDNSWSMWEWVECVAVVGVFGGGWSVWGKRERGGDSLGCHV